MRTTKRFICGLVNRFARHFGCVLISVSKIEGMESDARDYYNVMKREGISPQNKGYFNGLADYASKTALQLRERYLP